MAKVSHLFTQELLSFLSGEAHMSFRSPEATRKRIWSAIYVFSTIALWFCTLIPTMILFIMIVVRLKEGFWSLPIIRQPDLFILTIILIFPLYQLKKFSKRKNKVPSY